MEKISRAHNHLPRLDKRVHLFKHLPTSHHDPVDVVRAPDQLEIGSLPFPRVSQTSDDVDVPPSICHRFCGLLEDARDLQDLMRSSSGQLLHFNRIEQF